MARSVKYPRVLALRLSDEGMDKLQRLAVKLDRSEADVMRFLINRAQVLDVNPVRFDRGEQEHEDAEMCQV